MAQNGTVTNKVTAAEELAAFDALFPEMMADLHKSGLKDPETADAVAWFIRVSEYNVPHGKKNRGVSVVTSYRHLVKNPTEKDLKIARILGWNIEYLQAYFLVADDMMDGSITRRGQPCWYKQENVGLTAINDGFFLESFIYTQLMNYVKKEPYYVNVLELFITTNSQTVTGQCLDMITAMPEGQVDFTKFTMDRYSAIVKWKTAFYSFYLPVALAMHMAGISDDASHAIAKDILLHMGHFFQVQDDYLDCFGKPEVIGKIGTDIQDNKCSWMIVKALELATDEQVEALKANYGRHNDAAVQKVKDIYNDLQMEKVYRDYEDSSYKELMELIVKTSGSLPKAMFTDFAEKIFKREK